MTALGGAFLDQAIASELKSAVFVSPRRRRRLHELDVKGTQINNFGTGTMNITYNQSRNQLSALQTMLTFPTLLYKHKDQKTGVQLISVLK